MGRKYRLYGIHGYQVIAQSRISRKHKLQIKTSDLELIRSFLALKHRVTTADIKFQSYPIYHYGFKPELT